MIVKVFEKTKEIELFGNAKEMDFLSTKLLIDNAVVNLENETFVQFPNFRCLDVIRIKHLSNQLVKISVEDNLLI